MRKTKMILNVGIPQKPCLADQTKLIIIAESSTKGRSEHHYVSLIPQSQSGNGYILEHTKSFSSGRIMHLRGMLKAIRFHWRSAIHSRKETIRIQFMNRLMRNKKAPALQNKDRGMGLRGIKNAKVKELWTDAGLCKSCAIFLFFVGPT